MAAKYLAREDSSTAGILACGVQGRSNLEALSCLFSLTQVKAYDIYPEVSHRFAREMSEKLRIDIQTIERPREAVADLDLVVTSGPIWEDPDPIIEAGWLSEGSFACPVDFDSYWQGNALEQAEKLMTDDLSQFHYYKKVGYFKSTPDPYADLGEIAAGKKPGRETRKERTICVNLGIALEDMATAIRIYERAKDMGVGQELPL